MPRGEPWLLLACALGACARRRPPAPRRPIAKSRSTSPPSSRPRWTSKSASARCAATSSSRRARSTIRADRIEFKQNADNSLSATAYGNPVSFRQKKRRRRRVFRRLRAARRVRRPEAAARAVRQRAAEAGQRRDPQQLRFLQQRHRALQGRGPPGRSPARRAGPGARVRGVFQPKSDSPCKDGKARARSDDAARRQGAAPQRRQGAPLPQARTAAQADAAPLAPCRRRK